MLRLRAFGGLGLQSDTGAVAGAGTQRKALTLLAAIAVARSHGVARDTLVALFWPESDAERARGALKQTLHVLRRVLGAPDALLGTAELRLNPAVVESDVGHFLDALDAGEPARAVALYTGPFLDGAHVEGAADLERWVTARRAELARQYRGALERLARAADARAAREEAVEWWRRLQSADLLDGRAAVGLLQALDAAGDRVGALQHARVHEALVREELGVEPDPAVVALVARLRAAPPPVRAPDDAYRAPAPRSAPAALGAGVAVGSTLDERPVAAPTPPVAAATVAAPAAAPAERAAVAPAGTAPAGRGAAPLAPRRAPARLVAALAVLALAAAAWGWRTSGAAARSRAVTSVAVLPFANMGPDRQDDYLCDGVADEITTALGRVDGLRVAARTSAFAFRGSSSDVRTIGRTLGVGHVLEGSVRHVGDRLRITARLIDARAGYRVWSAEYEGASADLFAMQAEISHAIAAALAGPPAPAGGAAGGAPGPPAAAAYRLFLQGRHAWRQRRAGRLLEARAHFEGAVAADPEYAGAHAGLADVYAVLPDYGDFPPEEMYRAAEASARRALALDSTLAGPHATLGLVRQRQYRWPEAEASYARALALNPSYAPARQWHGKALVMRGRVEAGLAELERARALDPLSPVIHYNVGQTLLWNGRTAAAAAEFATALALDSTFAPARTQLAFAHVTEGRVDAALAEFRRAAGPGPPSAAALAQLGYGLARAGHRDSAAAILAGLEARARRSYVSPALLALLHVGLGDRDRAVRLFERAVEQRDPDAQGLVRAPMLAPLRADPRFARLTERMRLE